MTHLLGVFGALAFGSFSGTARLQGGEEKVHSSIIPDRTDSFDGRYLQFTSAEEKPKRGLELGVKCVNPFNGEEIPVFATNYVISDFGTGAVMAVPAHDTRDYAFALEYGQVIREVIVPAETKSAADDGQGRPSSREASTAAAEGRPPECYTEKGICVNSGEFDGLDFPAAKAAMDAWLAERKLGGAAVQYRLRDWNMSRQRFWGAPIPMVHCDTPEDEGGCGWQAVPAEELPVRLPEFADYSDIRVSPLANDKRWQHATCPACGWSERGISRRARA